MSVSVVPNDAAPLSSSAAEVTSAAPTHVDAATFAAVEQATGEDAHPPPSRQAVTGLTPEQVLQELRNSGYIDQLRRQMIEAFNAAGPASARPPNAASPSAAVQPASADPSKSDSTQPTSISAVQAESASAPTISASTATASSSMPAPSAAFLPSAPKAGMELGSKAAFLATLAEPLKQQVEKEHDRLRFLAPREQQDKLLQLLESEPVAHPQRESHGEASLFDLLVRHIVAGAAEPDATAGVLSPDGRLGKQAAGRIAETIAELLHPASKDADEADDDEDDADDDVDDEEDAEQIRLLTGRPPGPASPAAATPDPTPQPAHGSA
ncbi:hypothetical protein PANT_7d00038 [Moesziomyces antarcticus T-34]|uniref:Uncharacterized protein n=1 Tax=Pseudozyma antarctica (strain T-34) TaxID=1151754 RepID=M9MB97_PSEA3|nr:hypothetical protein PANT_7d00038 [Moesziomyces antarcticus T-34]